MSGPPDFQPPEPSQGWGAGDDPWPPASEPPGGSVPRGLMPPGSTEQQPVSPAAAAAKLRGRLVAAVAVLSVLVVVAAVVVVTVALTRDDAENPDAAPTIAAPSPDNAPSPDSAPSPEDAPTPGSPAPSATAMPKGKLPFSEAKVKGPVWRKGESTWTMRLKQLGLVFRTPRSWGCMVSAKARPPNVRWVCLDESGKMRGTSLLVEVSPCANGCPAATRRAQLEKYELPGGWKKSDSMTHYSEASESGKHLIAMLRFWHQDNATPGLNAQLFVTGLAAKESHKDILWKMINDLRANT